MGNHKILKVLTLIKVKFQFGQEPFEDKRLTGVMKTKLFYVGCEKLPLLSMNSRNCRTFKATDCFLEAVQYSF